MGAEKAAPGVTAVSCELPAGACAPLPPDQGTAWAAREPQAEYAVIAGAGQCSNYDQPAQTDDVIRPFLQRNLPG